MKAFNVCAPKSIVGLLHGGGLDASALRRAAAYTLLLMFAAHAFCFMNLTYSSASVMVNVSKGAEAQIVAGQYAQPLYWRVRGALSAPLLVGLLSALYMACSTAVSAWLLGISRPLPLFALCGAMTVNAAVTSVCAGALHTADAAFLSMLLGVLAAALCVRLRFGAAVGAVCLAAAMALDAVGPACGAALAVAALCRDALAGERPARTALGAGRVLLALAAGFALYYAGWRVMRSRYGLGGEAAWRMAGGSTAGAWLYPALSLLEPLSAYPALVLPLRVLLAALALCALALCLRRVPVGRGVSACLCVLALPLAANLPTFAQAGVGQTSLAFCFLDVLAVALVDAAPGARFGRLAPRALACAMGALCLGGAIFANQVYLKKNLEFQSTLSVMTRVLDRAEQVQGYQPGSTPVAIVGTLEDSVLIAPHRGFEHLAALHAAAGNSAVASQEDQTWYMWEIMGYPCNLVSSFELGEIGAREDVRAMPVYPAQGSVGMVDGTLVIKLSKEA